MLCTNIVLSVKTKTKKQFLYRTCSELVFLEEFNEQSLIILWVYWCKSEGFWKRFTCKNFLQEMEMFFFVIKILSYTPDFQCSLNAFEGCCRHRQKPSPHCLTLFCVFRFCQQSYDAQHFQWGTFHPLRTTHLFCLGKFFCHTHYPTQRLCLVNFENPAKKTVDKY